MPVRTSELTTKGTTVRPTSFQLAEQTRRGPLGLLKLLKISCPTVNEQVSGRIRVKLLKIVPRYQARVLVRLRSSVLDPAGEAVRGAAARLGVDGIDTLRIGKAVEMELEAPDEAEARRRIELLSDRLLANPVIEDWSLELQDS